MKTDLPPEYQNVMITYTGEVRVRDKYYDHYEKMKITRRAFYTKSDGYYDNRNNWINTPSGYFCVPQYWQKWNGNLVPHTFYNYPRVLPNQIIDWNYETEKT